MSPEPIDPTEKTLDQLVHELVEQGNGTAAQLEELTEALDRNTRRRKSNNVAALIVVAAIGILAVFNNAGVRELQQQICPLVVLLGSSGTTAPPSTDRGRQMSVRADALAERWDCTR